MAMDPIPEGRFNVGDVVYRVTSRSGDGGISVRRGRVVKRARTRITVDFNEGVKDQYYNRYYGEEWPYLSLFGEGAWVTTTTKLYPGDAPQVSGLLKKAEAHKRAVAVHTAARAMIGGPLTDEKVDAMAEALKAWKGRP